MNRVGVVAMVCVALAAGSGAKAQAVSKHLTSSEKSSPSVRLAGARKAAGARVRHLRTLERRAIKEAQRAQVLAGHHPMVTANVEKHALLAQKKLEEVMSDLTSAKGTSSHLNEVRSHQAQALTAARALLAAAISRDPSAATISSDASTVVQHAEAAEALLTKPTATDDWINP